MEANPPEGELIPSAPPEHQDEFRIPGLQFFVIAAAIVTAVAVCMLFAAIVSAPLVESMFGGLLGVRAVYMYSAIAAIASFYGVKLRHSQLYAVSTGRPRPAEDVRHDWGARLVYFLLFLGTVCAFNASFRSEWHFGLAAGHDQPQYYAYLHSWVFDQDVNFENELKAIPGVYELMEREHPERPEYNVAPIGSPVLWMPFYLSALAFVHGMNAWGGVDWPTDGISAPYATASAFGSMSLALAGLLLTHAALRRYFSHRAAFFAVLLTAVGTPLMWYVIDQPLMSHAPSFFAAALVFFLWAGWRDTASFWRYGLLGAAIGLAMLVRPSHAVMLVLPLADWALDTSRAAHTELSRDPDAAGELPPFAKAGIRVGLLLGAVLAVFSLQLLTWFMRYGFDDPPGSPMQLFSPNMVAVLYSAHNGLFPYHPVVYAGFLGVPLLWRKSRVLCVGVGVTLLLYVYSNSAIQAWWGGGSFGMRRFVGTLPFVAPGIAAAGCAVVAVVRRRPTTLVWATAALLLVWNVVLSIEFKQEYASFYQPKTFENVWRGAATIVHERVGNPATYPVSLWFSLRNGVRVGRYDYLSGFRQEAYLGASPPDATPDVDLSTIKPVTGADVRQFLGRGWRDTIPDFRRHSGLWCAKSRRAALLLPLRKGWTYEIELTVIPPPRLQATQQVKFYLNGQPISQVTDLPQQEETGLRLRLPPEATRDGVNELLMDLALEYELPSRNDTEAWPGSGLKIETWKPHLETLYLRSFKVMPL